jgi:hypothetical protein
MPSPQPETRSRSDSLRSALRAFASRARTRGQTADTNRQPTPPQKDPGSESPHQQEATRDAITAPAESVRVTDRPASGDGRSYLVERELHSNAELEAVIADYLDQASRRDAIPCHVHW